MKHLCTFSFLMLAILLPATASAYTFVKDGIYYNISGSNAIVTYKNTSYNSYSGDVIIPETVTYSGTTYSVTSIGKNAFYRCSDLTSVSIPSSVTSMGDKAFFGCSAMTSVHIKDLRVWCNISFSSDDSNPLYYAHHLFMNGEEIKNLVIPSSVTSIAYNAFCRCSGITSVTIPNSVIFIGSYAFRECSGMTSVHISDLESWCKIPFGNAYANPLYYAHHLYLNGEEVKDLVIPNTITSINDYAFYDCDGVTGITIPNSVTSIGKYAFYNCNGITSITIPHSVTKIGEKAFHSCYNLKNVALCGNLDSIGANVFTANYVKTFYIADNVSNIPGLGFTPTEIYCFASTPPSCHEETFTAFTSKLHVPAASLASYFTTPIWENFDNMIGDAVVPLYVSLSQNELEIELRDTALLTALVSPNNSYPNMITWHSTNTAVATVENGYVTAVATGECDIIAQCFDKQAICHVIVKDVTITITLDKNEAQVLPNHIITLSVFSSSEVLPELTVSSSDPTIASARVTNGIIRIVGIKEGYANITVGSADGTAIPATCRVTVYTEPGDLNCDGFLSISDVTSLINYLLSGDSSQISSKNADVNGDERINISDLSCLINILLQSN